MASVLEKLKITIPIIQAGMAGGITTPELVAAVSNSGALGTVGAGYMNTLVLKEAIQRVKQLTDKPFAVNLFAANLEAFSTDVDEMQALLNKQRDEIGLDQQENLVKVNDYLQEKVYILIKEKVPIVSTAFGVLSSVLIERLKENNTILIGMATNIDEAKLLEDMGYDIVVAQGVEAGGHRGTFDIEKYPNGSDMGLIALVQSILENTSLPVVAAGGIYTKKQLDALLIMGASGVQLGTRFLLAKEAGTNKTYRRALMKANYEDTVITKVFSGRPARAIKNGFIDEVESSGLDILPFPIQNELTKDLRSAGAEFAIADLQSLWAGQGVGALHKEESVEDIIGLFVGNTEVKVT
ncbi:NAD(P)H-dependent flavin oxidoreductase [Oceanobacillus polygoni]|uniref:Probable nitronate monooxygenase n=1 Tax=Oceanobacillus polygoni TaxID=1235259 RepID=A0A9X0YQP0_9BACI|nr:nitronate monooxygenase family protein [Oceanobacillus polygoni]MBP2076311.1 nitronate monooxygenase [Oceanobacillus polygoni]